MCKNKNIKNRRRRRLLPSRHLTWSQLTRRRRGIPAANIGEEVVRISAGEKVAYCEPILHNILQRLPGLTLLRFKRVQKSWKHLISNPMFVPDHVKVYNYTSAPLGLFLTCMGMPRLFVPLSGKGKITPADTPFLRLYEVCNTLQSRILLIQSCNGLLLLKMDGKVSSARGTPELHFLYNPATVQITLIPNLPTSHETCRFVFVFEPRQSSVVRVFCLVRDKIHVRDTIHMYSSEEKEWTEYHTLSEQLYPGATTLHYDGGIYYEELFDILRFDINTRQEMSLTRPARTRRIHLMESGGYLLLIPKPRVQDSSVQIYQLEKETFKFVLKWSANICNMTSRFPSMKPKLLNYSVLAVVRGEREEDNKLIVGIPKRVIEYNLLYNSVREIGDIPPLNEDEVYPTSFIAHPYFDTLFPLQESVQSVTAEHFCNLNPMFQEVQNPEAV